MLKWTKFGDDVFLCVYLYKWIRVQHREDLKTSTGNH
jgi:hypothetical protein